jgi:hypothetical protein
MTRKERAILRQAGDIIKREISAGREIRIPGFGKFWRSYVYVRGDDHGPPSMLFPVARFRAWKRLKEVLGDSKRMCGKTYDAYDMFWVCSRFRGHDGRCGNRTDG